MKLLTENARVMVGKRLILTGDDVTEAEAEVLKRCGS